MKANAFRRFGPTGSDGLARSWAKHPALILASVAALPAFFRAQTTESKRAAAEREVTEIVVAIEKYRAECGELPDCLHLLVLPDEGGKVYLPRKGMPLDPWGTPYEYDYSEGDGGRWDIEVRSFASDRRLGGEGEAEDIRRVSGSRPPSRPAPSAKVVLAKAEITTIAQAVQSYQIKNGRLPESLVPLVTPDENGATFLQDRREIPVDPWGSPYLYEPDPNGMTFSVTSLGRDGEPGGEGDDGDISNKTIANERHASAAAGGERRPESGPAAVEDGVKTLGKTYEGLQAGLAGFVVQDLADAVIHYRIDHGRLPESLDALVVPDARGNAYLRGETPPPDPWGRPYGYRSDGNGRSFTISSNGKDGRPGGEGLDADIRFSADAAVRPRKAR